MTLSPSPRVSIILPTWNRAVALGGAIESVVAQSFREWELLVLDDGSTDATPDIVRAWETRDPRVHYIRNETNLGIQKTLNRGLQLARGRYGARIDDDDAWSDREKLARQVEFLDAHPDHVLVGTGVVVVDEHGAPLTRYLLPETDSAIRGRLLMKNCFVHSTVLFRTGAVRSLGGYSEEQRHRHVEDYELWLRLGAIGKLANLPLYAVRFALAPGTLSSRNKIEQFKKDIALVRAYRGRYPHALFALIYGYLRFLAYRLYALLPSRLQHVLFQAYKERY
jgi:glycosyltransferase involved in cell wall biosynthesis